MSARVPPLSRVSNLLLLASSPLYPGRKSAISIRGWERLVTRCKNGKDTSSFSLRRRHTRGDQDRAVDSGWREEEEEVTFFINVTVQRTGVSRDCLLACVRNTTFGWIGKRWWPVQPLLLISGLFFFFVINVYGDDEWVEMRFLGEDWWWNIYNFILFL